MTRVVAFGHVCIDRNDVDGQVSFGWGSALLYISQFIKVTAERDVALIAPYGTDFLDIALPAGQLVTPPNGPATLRYENIVRRGSRRQSCYNVDALLPITPTDDAEQCLKHADIFFFAPLLPTYTVDEVKNIVGKLPNNCLKLFLPQGYCRTVSGGGEIIHRNPLEVSLLADIFDVVVISDEDTDDVLSKARLWVRQSPALKGVVVTQNKRGATVVSQQGEDHIATVPLSNDQIVNPVGAGDVFSAQLALSLYDGSTLPEAVQQAHKATYEKLSLRVNVAAIH